MSRIFSRHSGDNTPPKKLKEGLVPISIVVAPSETGVISFADGTKSNSSCLRCTTAPCMSYAEVEVTSASLPEFPADRNPAVCPAGAIFRVNGAAPIISKDACILCGVCASRCPVGAISMMPHAVVIDEQSNAFLETSNPVEFMATFAAFQATKRTGEFLEESDDLVDEMQGKLLSARTRVGDRFSDHLARNLLLAAGAGAAMRRKGDNAVRMDIALGHPWPIYGCAEAEFGDVAILDAPRDLMDDVAVSVSRLGMDKDSLIALVVTDVLPNKRSEYWRIIQDVREILGVRIGTVTVLALCLVVWRGRKLSELPPNLFHVDIETESYRVAVLEPLLGRQLKIGFAPRSLVDVAK